MMTDDLVFICCVLQGEWPIVSPSFKAAHPDIPDLGARYVRIIHESVQRYAPRGMAYRFAAFTDRRDIPGVATRPLPRGIYGWFNKLWLFSPDAFPVGTRVLCFDLDTAIVGDLTALATVALDLPIFLRDVWGAHHAASGVFSFRSGPALYPIWSEFERYVGKRPPYIPNREHPMRGVPGWGQCVRECRTDEQWLHHFVYPNGWRAWQEVLPSKFLSYKHDILRMRANAPEPEPLTPERAKAASIVYFHGQPRPHDVIAPWNPHCVHKT